jgi:nucleoside-diphosphate-sugar epimerase
LGGGNNPISINQTISWIEERLGKKAIIKQEPFHIADIKETWADISKANRLLGWKPGISVQDGINRTIDDFIENIDFYRRIILP